MARTNKELTPREEIMVGELNTITNSKILYKDGSGTYTGLGVGTNLSVSGGNLNSSLIGDVVGPASSTDGEIPLFSGISGKILKNSSKSIVTTLGADDTTLPTSKAVNDAITTAVIGLLDYRGSYNASTNLYPATGGSGIAGAILKGDFWICSVAGTLGGTVVTPGDLIIALIDTPAQTSTNWDLISHDLNYVPENVANKITSISGTSTDVQYASAKLLYDQLLLKANLVSPIFTGISTFAGIILPSITKVANYTITTSDYTIRGDTTRGNVTITLPTAVGNNQIFVIKKIVAVNSLIIATTSAQTIDGSATITLNSQYSSIGVQSNGTNWDIIY